MKRPRLMPWVALLALLPVGCGKGPDVHSTEKLVTSCMCEGPDLSKAQFGQTADSARSGNVSAQRKLWDYYLDRHDEKNALAWEDRLIEANDSDALSHRSSVLFSEAHDLSDADPKKLALIKQSLALEARYRKAVAGRVLHVMVNGKFVDIHETGEPDDGTRNMRAALARAEAAQHQST